MRRKVLVTILILVMVTSVLMLTACNSEERATDLTSFENAQLSGVGESIYKELEYIATNYKDRSYGKEAEKVFATYLQEKLTGYGYINESETFKYKNLLTSSKEEELTSTNVIFKKDNPNTDKAVLITSQIDNMYDYEGYNDEGIYGGATGVAIMLELAKNMKDMTLPYDVYFVGFGANSMSLMGASEFFDKFYIHHKKVDTLLAVDLSKPIGGDHMYIYTDEVRTEHGDYFDNVAKDAGLDYRKVPGDKQPMSVVIYEKQPMQYTHVGLFSSNILFVSSRIPTLNFVSVNWEEKAISSVLERKGMSNIATTKRDNFEFFLEIVGKDRIVNESDMVYTTIMNGITKSNFVDAMESSIANMPDYSIWSSQGLQIGLRLGLMAVIIIAAMLISAKFRKGLPERSMEEFMTDIGMGNMNNPNASVDPFGGDADANSDDPFREVEKEFNNKDKENKNNNKSSGDDIFGF